MAHQSFSQTVLDTLTKEALSRGGEVSVSDLSCALHLQTRADHKRMLNTLSDLAKSGRAVRRRQGVYAVGRENRQPDKREVMWRTLRMRKSVTIADLQELAGVSRDYAKQWLAMLVARKIAVRIDPADITKPRTWRLVKNDLTEVPVDTQKAARLRSLRRKKKQQALSAIEIISSELGKVRSVIENIDDEE